ncbi:hypothetical protein HPB51_018346 [Rhipicephalus microplus]|uniref:Uncharacterized protein n=1 Tax=Rhipicephalus microplus TaxID=6941 RepID=A0A9J6EU89_RHIMP|nr:hypothetical protein HPB51_018346 [Rhipicephalus microplus]
MKVAIALVASLVGVLIVPMVNDSEAKVGLALAPFIWAGHMAKDATHSLVAYKVSLATKALAMITGNRSFRATISYDSRLERYEDTPAESVHYGVASSSLKSSGPLASPPKPAPVDIEVPVMTQPAAIPLTTRPPSPKIDVPKVVVPQLPRIVVPKLVVPKIILAKVAVPIVQSKVDLLRAKINGKLKHLGGQSAGLLVAPKYASGYIQGGFRVGHGTGRAAEVHLGSIPATTGPAAQLGSDPVTTTVTPAEPRSSVNKTEQNVSVLSPPWFHNVSDIVSTTVPPSEPRSSVNETEQNVTANHSRPARSVDAAVMGRYFQFIQANDEGRCVALMVCSMAAHPHQFGAYGRKVVDFFDDMKPRSFSPVAVYKEASSVGRSGGSCRSRYPSCQVDPKYLAQLGESHIHL